MRTSSAVRRYITWAPLGAVFVLLLPALSAAQEPVKSFDQLNTRLKPGDTVSVTDTQGREVKGKLTELHDVSMTLDRNGPTTLRADDVRLVERRSKSVWKAALWGLVIGGGVGLGAAFAERGEVEETCPGGGPDPTQCDTSWSGAGDEAFILVPIGMGIGAGVGAVVRAVLPAGRKEVYRAPGSSGSARLSIAPVITPRTKGVVVALSF